MDTRSIQVNNANLYFIRYPQLPCIDLGRGSYLPMELCKTELSQKKNLSDQQTATIIKETAIKAPDRLNYIDKWINASTITNDPILKEYNVDLKLKMIELEGRVLSAPDIEYNKNTKSVVTSREIGTKGAWDQRNRAFANPVMVNRWVILNTSNAREEQCNQMAHEFYKVGKMHGMAFAQPLCYMSTRPKPQDRELQYKFEEIVKKYHSTKDRLSLIVVIMAGSTSSYKCVKTMGDIEYGIPTQIIDAKTLFKMNPNTASNVLLKINTKLNGRNFLLSPLNHL